MSLNGERTKACDEFMRENDEQAKVTAFGRLMFILLLFYSKSIYIKYESENNPTGRPSSFIN
jgi:hypothetical protein